MAEERIQKIMSEQGLCSRRAAEQIIAEGRVKVNGHPVTVGDKMEDLLNEKVQFAQFPKFENGGDVVSRKQITKQFRCV